MKTFISILSFAIIIFSAHIICAEDITINSRVNSGAVTTEDDSTVTIEPRGDIFIPLDNTKDSGVIMNGDRSTVIVKGRIFSSKSGIEINGNGTSEKKNTVIIEIPARVMSKQYGIISKGDYTHIHNDGLIQVDGQSKAGILITGDNSSVENGNSAQIHVYGENAVAIKGGDGSQSVYLDTYSTTISATEEFSFVYGTAIDLGDGDDTLEVFVGAEIYGDVYMGDGDDTLSFAVVATIDGDVFMGEGNDSVTLKEDADIDSNITLGEGHDTFNVEKNAKFKGTLDAGSGDDTINVFEGATIDADLIFGAGDDTVTVMDGATIKGDIDLGADNDIMNLYSGATVNGDINFGDGDNVFDASGYVDGDINFGTGNDIMHARATSKVTGNINFGDGDDIMNIQNGAIIKGAIDFGAGYDTLKIPQMNLALTFEDLDKNGENPYPENLETNDGVFIIKSGIALVAMDKSGQSVKSSVLNSLTSGLHGVIHKRMNQKPQSNIWSTGIHSYRKRGHYRNTGAFDHEYNGGMGGIDWRLENTWLGFVAGYTRGNVEANSESFRTDSNSYFGGVYGQYDFGRMKLKASLIGGYEDHENTRIIYDFFSGIENARADLESIFISPSISMSVDYKVASRILLRPSASFTYSAGWYEDYREHGATRANFEIDSRMLEVVNVNVGFDLVYILTDWCRLGINASRSARYIEDESISGNLGNYNIRFDSINDGSVYGVETGANLDINLKDNLAFNISGQHTEREGDETQNVFNIGFKYVF